MLNGKLGPTVNLAVFERLEPANRIQAVGRADADLAGDATSTPRATRQGHQDFIYFKWEHRQDSDDG